MRRVHEPSRAIALRRAATAALVLALALIASADPGDARAGGPPDRIGAAITSAAPQDAPTVYAFSDGWLSGPTLYYRKLSGRSIDPSLQLTLIHQDSGARIPVTVVDSDGPDTLHVRIDMQLAPEGGYDLEAIPPGGSAGVLRSMAYLGIPPQVTVPLQYPTIGAALAAVEPFTSIRVWPGTYEESLVIDRPVRLFSSDGAARTIVRSPADMRVVHILPSAGPLTEVEGFSLVGSGVVPGPGGGVLCEAPAFVRGNSIRGEVAGPGARGGGVYSVAGGRIVENVISGQAEGVPDPLDVFSDAPATGGTGGGLFCIGCLADGNDFSSATATAGGGFVVDGIFRRNRAVVHSTTGELPFGALRGEIRGNHFEGECGDNPDNYALLVSGPSRFTRNVVAWVDPPMCGVGSIGTIGPVEFRNNTILGVEVYACLAMKEPSGSAPGRFGWHANIAPEVQWMSPGEWGCADDGGSWIPIPPESVRVTCNLPSADPRLEFCEVRRYSDGAPPEVHGEWNLRIGPTSIALPENRNDGCPDTLGALGVGCSPIPVLLEAYGVESAEDGVRVFWQVPSAMRLLSMDLLRETEQGREMVRERIGGECRPCSVVDRIVPSAARAVYILVLHGADGSREEITLGSWEGGTPSARPLALEAPRPNPIRGSGEIAFRLPARGEARIDLFDPFGRHVAEVLRETRGAGSHHIVWRAEDAAGRPLPSGVYWLRLRAGGEESARRVLVLR